MACCGGSKSCDPSSVPPAAEETVLKENVQEFYGKTVKTRDDLKTGACLLSAPMTTSVKAAMKLIHDEVVKRNYGCGMPFPPAIDGCNILDLGSGTGRDAFVLSKLVGPDGRIVGVDMTQEQLDVANEYIAYHMEKFGYETPNVEFKKGFLEDLGAAGVPDDFFDVVVSNCVINLCKDKKVALAEAFRVLKNGGEIFFSDIYSNTSEIPEEAKKDKEAWGECLSGALWWKDLHSICEELGFSVPALVVSKTVPIMDERLTKILEGVRFVSATYRIFKADPASEKAPALVTYKGTIADYEKLFQLAKGIEFPEGRAVKVDEDLAAVLRASRYAKHFSFEPIPSGDGEEPLKMKEQNPFCCAEAADIGGCC